MTLPIIMDQSGPVVNDVSTIRTKLDQDITALAPGYTSNLPGTLVEDILSTDCGAVAACDQSRVDMINALSPYGVNLYLLNQLASVRGINNKAAGNMQVYLQFIGAQGWVIPKGVQATDGTYTYITQNTVIIGSSGTSTSMALAIATESGEWDIPANSVNTVSTALPEGSHLTVHNPSAGVSGAAESDDDYRARVMLAQSIGVQGSPNFIRTAVAAVNGALRRSVSCLAYSDGYLVTCAGGDPYDVAKALYDSVGDITLLRGSQVKISAVSNDNPAVITTSTAHGLINGQSVNILGATGITSINGTHAITLINSTQFSIQVDTSTDGTYTGGGFISNDPRMQSITIYDGPNSYTIPYIIPLTQLVGVTLLWNAPATASASQELISGLATPAIVNYINSLTSGSSINLLAMQYAIQEAISESIDISTLSRMELSVTLNGIAVSPPTGSYLVATDSLSYPYSSAANINVQRG